jgi:hypothetical protein
MKTQLARMLISFCLTLNFYLILGQYTAMAVVATPPTISSFTPTSGPVGTTVTITGTNFNTTPANNVVFFGATRAVVSAASATSLTVTVPTGATYMPISITDIATGLTAYSAKPFIPTFAGGPAFSANSFASKVDYSTRYYPRSIFINDLNGDGTPDLAFLNSNHPRYPWHGSNLTIVKNIGANSSMSFASAGNIPISNEPYSTSLSDLDGDGKADLVVTFSDDQISILRNTSTVDSFSFSDRKDIMKGYYPNEIFINDLDGDGKPDLIYVNSRNSLSIFRNTSMQGAISFADSIDIATNSPKIFIEDIDGDHMSDIIALDADNGKFSVLKNISSPGFVLFAPKVEYDIEVNINVVAFGDLDGDDKPDLIALNGDTLSIYKNTSAGGSISFATKIDLATGQNPAIVSIGDLDGDGKLDIALTNFNSNTISLYKNNSTNTSLSFAYKVDFTTGGNPSSIAIGDLNWDGKPDIAVTNQTSTSISVFRNLIISEDSIPSITSFSPATGTLGTLVTIKGFHLLSVSSVMFGGLAAASYSVVSDTLITAVIGMGRSGDVSVANHDRKASLAGFTFILPPPPVITSFTPTSGAVGTIITITGSHFNTTSANNVVFFGATRAVVSAASNTSLTITVPKGGTYQPISVTDITTGLTGYSAHSFIPTFAGGPAFDENSFGGNVDFTTGSGADGDIISDLDGDGKPDMVVLNEGSFTISVLRNTSTNGTFSFATKVDFSTGSFMPVGVSISDLDGDGRPDIVVSNRVDDYSSNIVSIFRNTSTIGNISFADKIDLAIGSSFLVKDMDGDGKPDFVVNSSIFRNTSTIGIISFADKVDLKIAYTCIYDLDEDGKPDLVLANFATNTVSVYTNTSSPGSFSFTNNSSCAIDSMGSSISNVFLCDLNGDSKPDFVAVNANNLKISVLRNTTSNGTISFAPKVDFDLLLAQCLFIGDLDGDGKPDFTCTSQEAYSVSMLRNTSTTDNISFANHFEYSINASGFPNCISIGDLNEDGKPDLAVSGFDNAVSVFMNTIMPWDSLTTITSFTPTSGVKGAIITIKGKSFTGTTAVRFGNVAASSYTIVSDTIITATLASGASGSVSVTNHERTATLAGFTFILLPAPAIVSFTPTSGAIGTTVTITGTHFNTSPTNNVVFFGATRAEVLAASATSITATVPSGATYKPISVTDITTGLTGYATQPFIPTFAGGPAFDANSFAAKVDLISGAGPNTISISDLDGDGKPDLAVTNIYSNTVSVFRNISTNGTTSFAGKADITIGEGPWGISFGDIDGDGKPDIAIANGGSNSVSVFRNISTIGNIVFDAKVDISTETPGSVSIGDLDGDGKPDLAVGNFNDSKTVTVFKNISTNGTISFADKVVFSTGSYPCDVSISDLDGDGKLDMALANSLSNTVSVLMNTSTNGSISFANKVDFTTGIHPCGLSIADFNEDGRPDFAVVNYDDNTVSILRNTSSSGTLSFAPKVDYILGLGPRSISVGDLNGDGKPDISIAIQDNNTVSVLKNNSMNETISFTGKVDFVVGSLPVGVSIGDLDGDGKPDMAVSNLVDNNVSVFRNTIMPPAPSITSFTPTSGPVGTTVTITGTNFNTTASNNIVFFGATLAIVSATTANSLTVTVPAGATYKPISVTDITTGLTGYAAQPFITTFAGGTAFNANSFAAKVDFTAGTNPTSVSISDLDGDGKPDWAAVNSKSNTVSVFRNIGTRDSVSFAGKMDYTTGIIPTNISVGDLDGDGKPDLVVTSTGKVSVFHNTSTKGAISFASRVDYATGSLPVSVVIGDMDGDGRPDLAVANSKSNTVSVFKNTSTNGIISFAAKVDYTTGQGPVSISIGDLDGDGKPELAVASVVGIVSVFRNTSANGSISFIPNVYLTTETGICGVSMGDLDGDGKLDMAVINAVANTVSVYRNTSTSSAISFAAKVDYVTGTDPASVSIGDLNGDGKPDLAVTNDGFNTVSVYRNTSASGTVSFADKVDYTTGTRPAIVSIGDLNGDGKPDLTVTNYYSNTVSVIRNTIRLNQTIAFAPIPVKTYGMADFKPGATSSSSLPVLYTSSNSAVATILSDQVHIVGSGSCFIYADQAGDASYNVAPQVSQSLTVEAKALTINADSGQSKKVGAADPMLTYTITEGSLVTGDSLTGALTYVSGEIVGTYAIQIGTLTAGSNYIITFIPNTFRIVSGTGINNIVADKPSIYPNPTSGLVSIDISEGTVIISDISGKVLLETTLKDHKTIDLGSFPSGIYVLMLKTKDSIYEFKILKN